MIAVSGPPRRSLLGLILVQALAGDVLLRIGPWGINLFLWSLLGFLGVAIVASRDRVPLPRSTWTWLAVAVACAGLVAGRAADRLGFLTVLAGVACLTQAVRAARGGELWRGSLTSHVTAFIVTAIHSVAGGLAWLQVRPTESPAPRPAFSSRPWFRIALGLVAALPLLVVFSSLFAAADPVFDRGLRSLVVLDFPTLIQHAVVMGAWGWITAGYSNHLLPGRPVPITEAGLPLPPRRPPQFEVLTCLILLAVLFVAFVAVQVRYLFGDDTLVRETAGLTYAEYARKGFFELVAVAGLLLPVLLAADWLLTHQSPRPAFRAVAGTLLVLLAVIMASAGKRLTLYVAAYGWTEARWYAVALLSWLALVAVAVAGTVLVGHRERFAGAALVSGLLVLGGLQASNPDAGIARHNLRRAVAGEPFDITHALRLGPDAVPVLVAGMGVLPKADQATLTATLLKRWNADPPPDWRTWNFGRAQARRAAATLHSPSPE